MALLENNMARIITIPQKAETATAPIAEIPSSSLGCYIAAIRVSFKHRPGSGDRCVSGFCKRVEFILSLELGPQVHAVADVRAPHAAMVTMIHPSFSRGQQLILSQEDPLLYTRLNLGLSPCHVSCVTWGGRTRTEPAFFT